ncbi:hypothetical protein ACFSL4_19675 [Streptomyces caeni]|uniref:Uncharacterized protein n=1 Tax=Streptomyces caeni TaxID=2307231 RepID=A0ABW4ITZ9_9ACTN
MSRRPVHLAVYDTLADRLAEALGDAGFAETVRVPERPSAAGDGLAQEDQGPVTEPWTPP